MKSEESTKNIGLRGVTVADSNISKVEGHAGKLLYRGYTIQELAEHATFEEVIYLLLAGSQPNIEELSSLSDGLTEHRPLAPEIIAYLKARPASAAPMDVMQGAVTALADLDPELNSNDRATAYSSCLRLIAGFASAAAAWQRLRQGKEPVVLETEQTHAAAFLQGLWGRTPSADEAKLMDIMLILHAEHTFNASTFAVREVASTQAHLYASISAGVGALSGALHGGANAKVMEMLLDIGDINSVEEWISKRLSGGQRIMGLGHAVYKTEDPRAGILRKIAAKVLEGSEAEKWFKVCLKVEKLGRAQLLAQKKLDLYPNVDFYSSPVLYGLGFPIDMFPVFFAVSRVSGWCAHFLEERFADAQPKPALYRPRAHYTGRLCDDPNGCHWAPPDSSVAGSS